MILRDLRKRGLKPWRCTIADGHLGLWAALGEQYPTLAEQRCWNHKITNVLDAMPKKYHAEARSLLGTMPSVPRPKRPARHYKHSSPPAIASWSRKRLSA